MKPNEKVISREGETGKTTGSTHECSLQGCLGVRVAVRWKDSKITYPCSAGMSYDDKKKSWKIL